MAQQPKRVAGIPVLSVDDIKKLTIIAMFSDDELMSRLVLKGGNALDLVHKVTTRASADIDFSISQDFPKGKDDFRRRVATALTQTFAAPGYHVFDVKMDERPEPISAEVRDFWGGYGVEFKLIASSRRAELGDDMEALRRNALNLGRGTKFLIDISRYEYTEGKEAHDFEGYRIFVYSVQMMVCEKLRAICQQMPEYGPVVKRGRPGAPRARDFVDIHALISIFHIDLNDPKCHQLLRDIFAAKRVPLDLLGKIRHYRDFHHADFPAVQDTVRAGVELQSFDFYFDFVVKLADELKSLWNV